MKDEMENGNVIKPPSPHLQQTNSNRPRFPKNPTSTSSNTISSTRPPRGGQMIIRLASVARENEEGKLAEVGR